MSAIIFLSIWFWQLVFLASIHSNFDHVGLSGGECLVFLFAWLLSDLAVMVHPLELLARGRGLSDKFKKTSLQSFNENPDKTSHDTRPEVIQIEFN